LWQLGGREARFPSGMVTAENNCNNTIVLTVLLTMLFLALKSYIIEIFFKSWQIAIQ
jgi:hypothetical protein